MGNTQHFIAINFHAAALPQIQSAHLMPWRMAVGHCLLTTLYIVHTSRLQSASCCMEERINAQTRSSLSLRLWILTLTITHAHLSFHSGRYNQLKTEPPYKATETCQSAKRDRGSWRAPPDSADAATLRQLDSSSSIRLRGLPLAGGAGPEGWNGAAAGFRLAEFWCCSPEAACCSSKDSV